MSGNGAGGSKGGPPEEPRIPVIQEMFDNIWFLFTISGVIILVSYITWGLIDLVNVPVLGR